MPDNPWRWDPNTRRYRDARGRFMSYKTLVNARDAFVEANQAWFAEHTARLADGSITLQQWERQFRERLQQI